MDKDTQGLLFAAQNDYIAAKVLLRSDLLFSAGLLTHQCVEKALKAILVGAGLRALDYCKNTLKHDLEKIGCEAAQKQPVFGNADWRDYFKRLSTGFQFRYWDDLRKYVGRNPNGPIISATDISRLDDLLAEVHKTLGLSEDDLRHLPLHIVLKDSQELAHLVMEQNSRVPDLLTGDSYRKTTFPDDPNFGTPVGCITSPGAPEMVIYEPA